MWGEGDSLPRLCSRPCLCDCRESRSLAGLGAKCSPGAKPVCSGEECGCTELVRTACTFKAPSHSITSPCCFLLEISTTRLWRPWDLCGVLWRDTSIQVLVALLVLTKRERLGLSRGEVLLCAEVSDMGEAAPSSGQLVTCLF